MRASAPARWRAPRENNPDRGRPLIVWGVPAVGAPRRSHPGGDDGRTSASCLHVDLSTGRPRIEGVPETVMRKYLGGASRGPRLFATCRLVVDPLGPDNVCLHDEGVINVLFRSPAPTATRPPGADRRVRRVPRRGWCRAARGGLGTSSSADGRQSPATSGSRTGRQVKIRDARPTGAKLRRRSRRVEQELGDKRSRPPDRIAGDRRRFAAIVNQLSTSTAARARRRDGGEGPKAVVVRARSLGRGGQRSPKRALSGSASTTTEPRTASTSSARRAASWRSRRPASADAHFRDGSFEHAPRDQRPEDGGDDPRQPRTARLPARSRVTPRSRSPRTE